MYGRDSARAPLADQLAHLVQGGLGLVLQVFDLFGGALGVILEHEMRGFGGKLDRKDLLTDRII